MFRFSIEQWLFVGVILMLFVIVFFMEARRVGYKATLIAWGLCLLTAALIVLVFYLYTGKL